MEGRISFERESENARIRYILHARKYFFFSSLSLTVIIKRDTEKERRGREKEREEEREERSRHDGLNIQPFPHLSLIAAGDFSNPWPR